jgi:hypothetical protein
LIKLTPDQAIWRCPWCPKDPADGDRHFYTDGDNLGLGEVLAPEEFDPDRFYAHLGRGQCPFCKGLYYGASLTMVGPLAVNDVRSEVHEYLWLNRPAEVITSYDAVHEDKGGLRWSVTSYSTPFGVMLEHAFGPFAMRDGGSAIIRETLIELWDDMKGMFSWADFLEKR